MSHFPNDERLRLVLPLINKPCDVYEIVAALHLSTNVDVQKMLCSKLYEAKSHEIEFFLPQLRPDSEIQPLLNFLLDKCSMSLHLGLLLHFIFQGAAEDHLLMPESPAYLRCKTLLNLCHAATVSSGKDKEMANIIRLFTNYQLQKSRQKLKENQGARTMVTQILSGTSSGNLSVSDETTAPISRDPSSMNVQVTGPFIPRQSRDVAAEMGFVELEVDSDDEEETESTEPPVAPPDGEFTEEVYHSLIRHFMVASTDRDLKQRLVDNLMLDVDLTEFDHQVKATANYYNFAKLSELVNRLVSALPSVQLNLTDSQTLQASLLELEKSFMRVDQRVPDQSGENLNSLTPEQSSQSDEFVSSLDREIVLKKFRQNYLRTEMQFVSVLTGISSLLKFMSFKTKAEKTKALRVCLQDFNNEFSRGVYVPILRRKGKTYRVIRIPYAECFTLNSRDRVPYMMFFEVVSGDEQEEMAELELPTSTRSLDSEEFSMKKRESSALLQMQSASLGSLPTRIDMSPAGTGAISPAAAVLAQRVTKLVDKLELIDEYIGSEDANTVPTVSTFIDRIYGESFAQKADRVRKSSPVGNRKNWELISVVMKSGDDLRQEQLATQLIRVFAEIFQRANLPLWLYPYEVLAVSSQGGFIETIPDALSIHVIKEALLSQGKETSLRSYFQEAYGNDQQKMLSAKRNFVESLAGYSLVCYYLQFKDRHNGNILLSREGHLIHIDYGFMLCTSPGGLNFESAPFKLTLDLIEVMDGKQSNLYRYFKDLLVMGFCEVRKHYKSIISLVQMMEPGSKMACFGKNSAQTMAALEDRFKVNMSDAEVISYAEQLIAWSEGNWRTDSYDQFQKLTNGILP